MQKGDVSLYELNFGINSRFPQEVGNVYQLFELSLTDISFIYTIPMIAAFHDNINVYFEKKKNFLG